MTLIEVMIALAIFAIAAGGIISASGMAHRTSVSNVADDIALHAAEGIMEQIRIMPCDPTLYALADAVSGSKASEIAIIRYVPAMSGLGAQAASQSIPANTAGPVPLNNVTLNATLDSKSVQTAAATLPMSVRILIKRATGVTAGVTVELIYFRYRSSADRDNAAEPASVHTLRTFIPAALQ